MGTGKQYDEEFKKQAIKLAKEIGTKAAADELCIPKGTLGTWVQKARIGEIDTGAGSRTPGESLTIAQQLQAANKRIKEGTGKVIYVDLFAKKYKIETEEGQIIDIEK